MCKGCRLHTEIKYDNILRVSGERELTMASNAGNGIKLQGIEKETSREG